jgi:hypothetical protein
MRPPKFWLALALLMFVVWFAIPFVRWLARKRPQTTDDAEPPIPPVKPAAKRPALPARLPVPEGQADSDYTPDATEPDGVFLGGGGGDSGGAGAGGEV